MLKLEKGSISIYTELGERLIQQKDTLVRKKLLMYEIKSLSIPLSVLLASSLLRLFNCDFHIEHSEQN